MGAQRDTTNSYSRPFLQAGLAVAFAALSVQPLSADEFHLASGEIVRGAIASESPAEYVIQTEVGSLKIRKSEVRRYVDQGTLPIEIEGDIALKKGDLPTARARYSQALTEAEAGSQTAQRLQEKLAEVTTTNQQATESQLVEIYNRALSLHQSQQFDAAQAQVDTLISRLQTSDPLYAQAQKLKAQIHYGKGMAALDAVRTEVARQELEAAIAADPMYYPAYISLGESMLGSSSTVAEGTELVEKGLEIAGDRISEQQRYTYLYTLGQRYFDQKMYGKAASTFAALIPARDRYPAYADALDRAVESYIRMGEESLTSDFRETITNLNTALKLNPNNEKALFLLGRIYLDIGQVENAIVTLSKLVQLNPRYDEANHYLGNAYFKANDYESALNYLSVEIGNDSDNYTALVDRAEVYIELGDSNSAETDLEAAKQVNPEHWRSYYLTALLAYNEDEYDDARTALLRALDLRKTALPAHLLMSRVLIAQDELEGARKWLDQVVERLQDTENLSFTFKTYKADALTQLGEIALEEDSPRQAENYLKSALEAAPEFAPAVIAMADTKVLLANDAYLAASKEELYDEAEQLYVQALKLEPNMADYFSKAGRFYQRHRDDNAKALEYYNKYVDLGGTDSRVNAWIEEAGGTRRPELAASTSVTASATTETTPTANTVTTATGTALPVDALDIQTTEVLNVTTGPAETGQDLQPVQPGQPASEVPAFPLPNPEQ